jgi:hypothetical protein
MNRFRPAAALLALSALLVPGAPAGATTANTGHTAGFYDHQIIEYEGTAQVTDSPRAAQQISQGLIVYHVVDATGQPPAVQCARLRAALPNDASDCNVLNRIPTDAGYTGGAWNLQVFHWKPGVTPTELSMDDDILAAAAAGLGTVEATATLVRCPVINFANLR